MVYHITGNVLENMKKNDYINEVFSEAPPQIFYEGCLAVVVFQQDKVLHPNPVPGSQRTLHDQTHSSLNVHLLHRKGEKESLQTYMECEFLFILESLPALNGNRRQVFNLSYKYLT